jgi:hypothetical protein
MLPKRGLGMNAVQFLSLGSNSTYLYAVSLVDVTLALHFCHSSRVVELNDDDETTKMFIYRESFTSLNIRNLPGVCFFAIR